jgi:hypothetical protein
MAMNSATPRNPLFDSKSRVLSPLERFSEVVFGLIMVVTITGSLSVAEAGHAEIRTMLIGAIGCNTAWGIVDAVMYFFSVLAERGRALAVLRAVRVPADATGARALVADALPPLVANVLRESDLDFIRQELSRLPEPPARARLTGEDFRGAVGVFLLVFLSTFPVVVPFLFMTDAGRALRVSNVIAVVLLFLSGYGLGRYSGLRPVRVGIAMAAVGAGLAALAMALGG